MPEQRQARAPWAAAIVAVAATYFYFLIFAEFSLLELARALDPTGQRLRPLMAVLGAGGVTGSLAAARLYRANRYRGSLAGAFAACAAAAGLAWAAPGWPALGAAAALAGIALGFLTVTLASGLRAVVGGRRLGLVIGAGTGVAYAACNLPWVFAAAPGVQTLLAGAAALLGVAAASGLRRQSVDEVPASSVEDRSPWPWLGILLVLVWLDSAAFYIIQHSEDLRAATWEGAGTLGGNAAVHLGAALASGWLVDRGLRGAMAASAYSLLALACLGLAGGGPGKLPVELLYTAGVSLYSVVLVEVPARSGRPWLAAAVFAVAGWLGSALGIGMAQDLARVPPGFVALAGVALALLALPGVRRLWPPVAACVVAGVLVPPLEAETPLLAKGREVYIAEGCIHCHSQYIRPETMDTVRWGPATPLADSLPDTPPLYGNRRQGPDLAQVGTRRSEAWNRLHLLAPRSLSPGSRMPAYAHLFAKGDTRGEALVAYLASLGAGREEERAAQVAAWKPEPNLTASRGGARRYAVLCASCHGTDGRGDGPAAAGLGLRLPDFRRDAWRHVRGDDEVLALMRIVKFGLPGTLMAGHEYLADADAFALALHVRGLHDGSVSTTDP